MRSLIFENYLSTKIIKSFERAKKVAANLLINSEWSIFARLMEELDDRNITSEGPLTLRKSAKLRHRSLVEGLFGEGKNIYDYPLRMIWRPLDDHNLTVSFRNGVPPLVGPLQMLVTVPKKKCRHAVDRVLMRRRIREAFRLHSRRLRRRIESDPDIRTLSLAFIYLHTENDSYAKIEKCVVHLLHKLERRLWPEPKTPALKNTDTPS